MQEMKPHMKNRAVTVMKAKRLLDRAGVVVMGLGILGLENFSDRGSTVAVDDGLSDAWQSAPHAKRRKKIGPHLPAVVLASGGLSIRSFGIKPKSAGTTIAETFQAPAGSGRNTAMKHDPPDFRGLQKTSGEWW
jgi:hypothetical protein